MRVRLIKPDWARPKKQGFIRDIGHSDVIEGDFDRDYIDELNNLGFNVYYFPNSNTNMSKNGWLSGADIDHFTCCFVDMDLKDKVYSSIDEFENKLQSFPLPPNYTVSTGNGLHAYWQVSDLDQERYIKLQFMLINQFKTDTSVWTICQLMRLPNTKNTKDPYNFKDVVKKVQHNEQYTYESLMSILPSLTEDQVRSMNKHIAKVNGTPFELDLCEYDCDTLPKRFQELLEVDDFIKSLFFNKQHGTRSESDYKLAIKLFKYNFTKLEAITVLANTSKALSKGPERIPYAEMTVEKAYKKVDPFSEIKNVTERGKDIDVNTQADVFEIHGPAAFDCLESRWYSKQCLGVIGSSGIGKSTVSLDIITSAIQSDLARKYIYVYFSLEMTDSEIIERFRQLTGHDDELGKLLYVISNEDAKGNPRNISLQDVGMICRSIELQSSKKIAVIVIDHIGVINPYIDLDKGTKDFHFGLNAETEGARGNMRKISQQAMPQKIKELSKYLNCFTIIQSQTTKTKGADGDTPLGIDAAYGVSQFEHYMDYIITLWQPLRRVHAKTDLRVMAWQYCKIRCKKKKDRIDTYSPCMLYVDVDTGKLRALTEEELETFIILEKESTGLRKMAEKKEGVRYQNSNTIQRPKLISIPKLVRGLSEETHDN